MGVIIIQICKAGPTWSTEFIKQVFPMLRRPLAPPKVESFTFHICCSFKTSCGRILKREELSFENKKFDHSPVVSFAGLSSFSTPFVWEENYHQSVNPKIIRFDTSSILRYPTIIRSKTDWKIFVSGLAEIWLGCVDQICFCSTWAANPF